MRLVAVHHGKSVAEASFDDEAMTIGSQGDCILHLPHESVAAHHAVVMPDGEDAWALQPAAPGTALQLNGVDVTARVQLRNNDQIQIGDYQIRVYLEDSARAVAKQSSHVSVAQMARFVQAHLPPGAIVRKTDEPVTLTPAWLMRLGKINVSVGCCNQVQELMTVALQSLLECFSAHKAWIGIRRLNYGAMDYVEGKLLTGQTVDLPAIGDTLKPRVLDRSQFVYVPILSADDRTSIITGPLLGPEGALGMVYIDTGDLNRRFESADLDFFVALMNLFGAQIDAILRTLAKNRAAMIDGEVSVAHAIQARLTPRKLPQWEQLQFGAFREPGRQRTSDIYDVVRMANQSAGVMIARSTAVGPLPGMLMAQSQAGFRTAIMHQDAPHVFMRTMNVLLYDGLMDHPLDCFMGLIDPATGLMKYSIAGSIGAYVIGARGDERKLAGEISTPALGTSKAAVYPLLTEQLDSSETVVLFTSGVVTARNSKDEPFGEERFVNILCDGFGQLASNMLKEMLSDLQNFTEGGQQPEDITVILAHKV